tara:strand:+ start:121015 stop:121575 length:561 start_codon:yes stop_codon:yes gene_type:complete
MQLILIKKGEVMNSLERIILDRNALKKVLDAEKAKGKKVVFTNGCFDILHRGHIDYMEKSKAYGDILVVALNTDASVKRLGKGSARPFNNLDDRAFHMAGLRSIDYVTQFDEDTPMEILQVLRPDVIVKGGDYSIPEIVGSDFVMGYGGKAYSIPFVEGCSTTSWLASVQEKLEIEAREKKSSKAG